MMYFGGNLAKIQGLFTWDMYKNVFCFSGFFVNILAESTALGGRAGSVLQLFPIITVHTLGCETRPFSQYQVVMH